MGVQSAFHIAVSARMNTQEGRVINWREDLPVLSHGYENIKDGYRYV